MRQRRRLDDTPAPTRCRLVGRRRAESPFGAACSRPRQACSKSPWRCFRWRSSLAAALATLRWLYLANANAFALGAEDMMVSPGLAVAWFFIPFANLFMPYLTMRDTWKASAKPRDWQAARRPPPSSSGGAPGSLPERPVSSPSGSPPISARMPSPRPRSCSWSPTFSRSWPLCCWPASSLRFRRCRAAPPNGWSGTGSHERRSPAPDQHGQPGVIGFVAGLPDRGHDRLYPADIIVRI